MANEHFAAGDYSTAFIPDYYPDGYAGDELDSQQMQSIALACHKLKNIHLGYSNPGADKSVMYVTVQGDDEDTEFKVELTNGSFTVTDLASGKESHHDVKAFDYVHNSLVKMDRGSGCETIQFLGAQNDLQFDFYYAGGKVSTMVYDEAQYMYKGHMAPPVKIDYSRSIMSPMPGAIVEVKVEVGQTVVDGQDLCVIEAMKMQNILKSERDGVIKSVTVKAGDSVAVDQLLIEFE